MAKDTTILTNTTTERGFQLIAFNDSNIEYCTLQQSSATTGGDPGTDFIWLGLHEPSIQIMKTDAVELGIDVDGEVSGWMDYKLPPKVEAFSRMHLNKEKVAMLVSYLTNWLNTGSFNG